MLKKSGRWPERLCRRHWPVPRVRSFRVDCLECTHYQPCGDPTGLFAEDRGGGGTKAAGAGLVVALEARLLIQAFAEVVHLERQTNLGIWLKKQSVFLE